MGLRQALTLYRHGHSGSDQGLPAPGVYRYSTSGNEALSLAGANRTFPTTSYMIVNDAGCASERWEPDEQHIEGLVICPSSHGGFTTSGASSFEQIAGTNTTQIITCPATTTFLPAHPRAGQRWQATCRTSGSSVLLAGQVIGRSSVMVGSQSVPTVHTRLTFTFGGGEVGTNPTDYWLSPSTGVVVRESETVRIAQSVGPLGSVQYSERMAIALATFTPER